MFVSERRGRCGEKQFQGRPCDGLSQMPAAHMTVGEGHPAMGVDCRRTVD